MNPKPPAFGYPMMKFHETPREKVRNQTVVFNTFADLGEAEREIKEYEERRHDINWKRIQTNLAPVSKKGVRVQSNAYEMIDNHYEHLRMLNAFEIIARSFTHGARLKRNPMSDEERAKLRALEEEEQERFTIYKRAWDFKQRKANSIGGYIVGDKTPFVLDWEERARRKAAQKSTAGRRSMARSR